MDIPAHYNFQLYFYIYKPIWRGGLPIRNMLLYNQALLGKWL